MDTKSVIRKKKVIRNKADAFNALLGSIKSILKSKQNLEQISRTSENFNGICRASGVEHTPSQKDC